MRCNKSPFSKHKLSARVGYKKLTCPFHYAHYLCCLERECKKYSCKEVCL